MSSVRDYDAALKRVYSQAEVVRSYLRYAGEAAGLIGSLDFSTLRRVPDTLVSETLKRRHADMIWQVNYRDGGGLLYVIVHIEFQSTNDPSMALRMLTYASLIYESVWGARREQGAGEERLPMVLPTVLYTGEAAWTAPLEVGELIADGIEACRPSFRYVLIDECRLAQGGSARAEDLAGALMLLRHGREYGVIRQAARRVAESDSYASNRRAYNELAKGIGFYRFDLEVETMAQMTSVLEQCEENAKLRWTAVGRQEGIEQGIEQGVERVAERMLNMGMSAMDIGEYTGLSLEQIKALQDSQ